MRYFLFSFICLSHFVISFACNIPNKLRGHCDINSLNGKNRFTALSVYHSSLILVDKIDILTCLKISTSQTLTSRYPINNFDPGKKYQQSTECRREVGKKYISRYVIPIGIPRNCLVSYCRIRDDKESCLTILYLQHYYIARYKNTNEKRIYRDEVPSKQTISSLSTDWQQIPSRNCSGLASIAFALNLCSADGTRKRNTMA